MRIYLHSCVSAYTTIRIIIIFELVVTGPSVLTVNIMKNIESSSIVVQWDDAVDDFLPTTYVIMWGDSVGQLATVREQTSYTITGLTLDTVYTITVYAANRCGRGPEFRTSISFSTDTTSTTSTINPTLTASTNPVTIISAVNPTTTTALSTTTANSMTTTVSRDTGNTTKTTSLTAITTTSNLDASIADTTTTTSVTITIVTTTTVITNTCLNIGNYVCISKIRM